MQFKKFLGFIYLNFNSIDRSSVLLPLRLFSSELANERVLIFTYLKLGEYPES